MRFVLMDIPHDVDPARASQCRPVVDIHGRRPGAVGIHGEDSLESFIDQIPRDAGRLSAAEGSRFGKVAWPTAVNGPTGGVTIVPLDVNPYLPAASATVHSRACANCAVPMTVAQSISLRCRAAGFMTIPPVEVCQRAHSGAQVRSPKEQECGPNRFGYGWAMQRGRSTAAALSIARTRLEPSGCRKTNCTWSEGSGKE